MRTMLRLMKGRRSRAPVVGIAYCGGGPPNSNVPLSVGLVNESAFPSTGADSSGPLSDASDASGALPQPNKKAEPSTRARKALSFIRGLLAAWRDRSR
jgi:hypothetical protein